MKKHHTASGSTGRESKEAAFLTVLISMVLKSGPPPSLPPVQPQEALIN